MKKALKFVKGKLNDKKEHGGGGLGPFSMELPSPGTPVDEDHSMPVDHAWGYYVDTSGKDKSVTKLHKAAWLGNLDKLKVNLKKIDIDAVDKSNRTPLHLACASGHTNLVWFLLNNKAKMTICDNEGRTPFLKAIECGHKDMVQLMLEKGVDITTVDYSGNSGLHIAAKRGLYEISLILLKEGAHFETSNILGEFPLHIATYGEHKDLVELLVRYGSSVNVVDRDHRSPLMFAAKNGNLPLVQLFLSKGAQRRVMDAQDWTAEDYALHGNHLDVAAELKSPSRGEDLAPPDAISLARRSASPANRSAKDADSDTWESLPSEDNAAKPVAFRRFVPPSSEDEASEGEGVIPPPCRPPRSWELLTSGAMDPAEPRPRSLLALGSLRAKRESLGENGESPSGHSEIGQGDAAQWVMSHSFSKHESRGATAGGSSKGRVPSIELDGRQLPLDGRTDSLGSDSEWDSDGSLPLDSVPVATAGAKQRVLLRVPPIDLNDEDAELSKELQRERSDSSHGNSKGSGNSRGNSKGSGNSHSNSKASGNSHSNSKGSGASHGKIKETGLSPRKDLGEPKGDAVADLLEVPVGPESFLGKVEIFESLLSKVEAPQSFQTKSEAPGSSLANSLTSEDKEEASGGLLPKNETSEGLPTNAAAFGDLPKPGEDASCRKKSPDRGTLGRPGTLLGYDEVWEAAPQASWQPNEDELLFPSPQLTEKSMDADSLESPPPAPLPPPPAPGGGARLKASTSLDFKKQTLAAYLHTASLSLDELDEPARRWQDRDRSSWGGPGPGPGPGRSLAESRRIDAQLACYDEALRDLARVSRPRPQRYLSLPRSNQLIDDAFKEMGHVSRSLPRTAAPADMVAEPLPPPRRRRRADSEGDRLGQTRRPLSLDAKLPGVAGAVGGLPDRSSEDEISAAPNDTTPPREMGRRRSSEKPIRKKRKTLLALRGLNHEPPNGSQSSGGEVGDSFEEQPFTISMDPGKGQLPRQCTVVERKDFRIVATVTPRSHTGKSQSGSRELLAASGTSEEADNIGLPPPPDAFCTANESGESRYATAVELKSEKGSLELVNYLPSDDSEFSRSDGSPRPAFGLQTSSGAGKTQLATLQAEKIAVEKRMTILKEQTLRLEYELADAKEAARCREEVTQLLQSQLDAMEEKFSGCQSELDKCRQNIRAQELELVHLKETCHQFGEEKEILHEIIKARDVEMDDLDKALRNKDYDRILRITRELKEREKEHTEMKFHVIDLEREKQKSLENIADLEKRNEELEMKLEQSRKQVKQLSEEKPDGNESLMWKELYESCLCKIEKMATSEEDFRAQNGTDRLSNADGFRDELREIIRRLEELKAKDSGAWQARIQEEVANAVALLRDEYASIGRSAAKHNEQLEQLVQKLQRDLEEAAKKQAKLEKELADTEIALEDARRKRDEADQSAVIVELRKVGGDVRDCTEQVRNKLDQRNEEITGRLDEMKGFHRTEIELLEGLRSLDDLKAANDELECRCSRLEDEAEGAGRLEAELANQRAAFAAQGAELERTLLVLKDTRNAAAAACARELAELRQRVQEAEAEAERVRAGKLCPSCEDGQSPIKETSPLEGKEKSLSESSVVNSLKADKNVEGFGSGSKVDNRTCPCPSNVTQTKIVLAPLKKTNTSHSNIALAESRSRGSFKKFDSEKEIEVHLPVRYSTISSLSPPADDNARKEGDKERKNQDAANKLRADQGQYPGCGTCTSPGHFEQSEAEFRRQINDLEQKVREENSKRFALEVQVNKMRYDLQEKIQLEKELGILRNRLEQDFVSRYELEQLRKTYEMALSRSKLDAEKTAVNDLNNKIGQISMLMDKQQQDPPCDACSGLSPEYQEARLKLGAEVASVQATLRAEKEENADLERRKLIEKGYSVNLTPAAQVKDKLILTKPSCKCSPQRCHHTPTSSANKIPYCSAEKSPYRGSDKSEKNPYTAVMRRELEKTISKHSQDALNEQPSSSRSRIKTPEEKDDMIRKNFFQRVHGRTPSGYPDDDYGEDFQDENPPKPEKPLKPEKPDKPEKPEKPPKEKGKSGFSLLRNLKKSSDSETEEKPKKPSIFSRKQSPKTPPPRPSTPAFAQDGSDSETEEKPKKTSIFSRKQSPKTPPPRPSTPAFAQDGSDSETEEKPKKTSIFSRKQSPKTPPPRPSTPAFVKDGSRSPCNLPTVNPDLKDKCQSPFCSPQAPPRPEPPILRIWKDSPSQKTSSSANNMGFTGKQPREKESKPKPLSSEKTKDCKPKSPATNETASCPKRKCQLTPSKNQQLPKSTSSEKKFIPCRENHSPCSSQNRQLCSTEAAGYSPRRKSSLRNSQDSANGTSSRSKTRLPYDDNIRKNFFSH